MEGDLRVKPGGYATSTRRNRARYQTALRWGMLVSIGVHAALFVLWRRDLEPLATTVAAGLRLGHAVAAPGGGVMEAIALAPQRAIVIPPPPDAVPELDAPEVEESLRSEPQLAPRAIDLRSGGSLASEQVGPGLPGATGRGDGGADAEGLFRVTAPEPRSIIPEWDPPGEVKGMQVMIRVLVDSYGQPTGDVELRPRTPNSAFNRRLIDKVLQMDYRPARRRGQPIPGWVEMTFVF